MLKPTVDRLEYGSLLQPPEGFELSAAIGTTYSLDLDALIGMCISLGLSGNVESELMKNPVYLLEALRKTADKVTLFCEAGQIKLPSNLNSLYLLLEKMVFQVALKKPAKAKRFPSFHPKFWLIKYQNKSGDSLYRAVVLSRNLTFDHSWDVAAVLEGKPGGETTEQSRPICDFLKYLSAYLPGGDLNSKSKRKSLLALANELAGVSFSSDQKMFRDFEFIPEGIFNEKGEVYSIKNKRLFKKTFHEVVIVSPFLTSEIVQHFNNRNTNIENPSCTLITRKSALETLNPEHCNKFKIYTMKDQIIDGEGGLSEGDSLPEYKQDLHAKMYLYRKYSDSDLYMGSLNATHSAMNGNIELMLRLGSTNRYLNACIFLKDLFGSNEKENPFEETNLETIPGPQVADETDKLQQMIKELCSMKASALVVEAGESYDLRLEFGKADSVTGLTISPLFYRKPQPIQRAVIFHALSILQLSEFYVVTATGASEPIQRIIKIPTEGIPEGREKQVISNIINNKLSFIEYIAFLLGDNYILTFLESEKAKASGSSSVREYTVNALYEKMLYTAAHTPERLKEIDFIVQMLGGSDIVPDEFKDLYETFKKAVGIK